MLPLLVILTKCGFDIYLGNKMRSDLKYEFKMTDTAVVISEIHYFPNSPISHDYAYKYSFKINGKEYKGVCSDGTFRPGNKILIDYVVKRPEHNCPHGKYKE